MSPTQKGYEVKISAPGVNCCRCGGSSTRSWDKFLPITRRGTFFQDSFFSNIHHDFDTAIRDVLNKWSDSDLTRTSRRDDTDVMGRYRQLRSRNLKEENQAITVSSDNTSDKIVLDVHDFMHGDVQVKIVGEKELVVEGRVGEEGSTSMSVNSFSRRLTLPQHTDMAAISSVMSSDGILTITAPKMKEESQVTTIPVKIEKSQNSSSAYNSKSSNASVSVASENISTQTKSATTDQDECQCAKCFVKDTVKSDTQQKQETFFTGLEQKEPSVSSTTSNFGRSSWDSFLPITRRGNFFHDSFFSDMHHDFDSSLREVLSRWSDTGLKLRDRRDDSNFHHSDILDHYRQLRSRDLKEENQAITVSSGNSSHKIVLDVHDFMGGDVKVKVVGEKELVVEGRMDKGEEGSTSVSSHSFKRRFTLPDETDMAAITSVMSSDGILTITAPKMVSKFQQNATVIPVEIQETRNTAKTQTSESSLATEQVSTERKEEEKTQCEYNHCYENRSDGNSQKQYGMKVPIKINGSVMNNNECQYERVNETQRKTETRESKSEASSQMVDKEEFESTKSSVKESPTRNDSECNFVPIMRRGLFFNDSVFQDTRKDFQRAIKEVLTRWGEESSMFDDITSYRNLRTRDLREENQAVTSLEDEHYHKFVIDVHDFMEGGEVNVKAVNDREVVVEGRLEKKEGGSKSVKRFLRRFVVPGDIQLDAVTSEMSSDGVLTISAPKKNPTIAIREVKAPMSIKERETESHSKMEEKMSSEQESRETLSTFKVETENQTKCNASTTSSVVDAASVSANDSHTREHIIPVQVETSVGTSNLEQLDSQHQVTIEEKQVSGDSHKTESERKANISMENDYKCCSESKYLPIIRKGLFSDDHFFENVRQNYSEAVRDVLEKANEWSCQRDAMQSYRSLRERNLQVENQAFNVEENEFKHKVVMDVHDFTSGDVTVSLVGGNELVVEGQAEKQEEGEVAKKSFVRRFLLPDLVDRDAITSALSSDGILTIISNKKGSTGDLKAATTGFSSETNSRVENHTEGGHSWEEKKVQESAKESEGCSVRTFASTSRSHHHQSSTKHF